jgi:hypothetical protein
MIRRDGEVCLNYVENVCFAGKTAKRWTDFSKRRLSQYAFSAIIGAAPHILWQNILDTQDGLSYTADNEKEVLINSI